MSDYLKYATWGPLYWSIGLLTILAWFWAGELTALSTNVYNSLTYYSRYGLQVVPGEPITHHTFAWVLSLGTYWTVTIWLTGHIWFGLWNG